MIESRTYLIKDSFIVIRVDRELPGMIMTMRGEERSKLHGWD